MFSDSQWALALLFSSPFRPPLSVCGAVMGVLTVFADTICMHTCVNYAPQRNTRVLIEVASAQTVTMEAFLADESVCTVSKVHTSGVVDICGECVRLVFCLPGYSVLQFSELHQAAIFCEGYDGVLLLLWRWVQAVVPNRESS